MDRELNLQEIGRFLMFLRTYDFVLGNGASKDMLRQMPVLGLLGDLFPQAETNEAKLRAFKAFYDIADLSAGNNFLTDEMKGNQKASIENFVLLMQRCRNQRFYTQVDYFIQWAEQIDDGLFTQVMDEMYQNLELSQEEKAILSPHREMFLFMGKVSAGMEPVERQRAEALEALFFHHRRGPYAVAHDLESSDDSSNDSHQ